MTEFNAGDEIEIVDANDAGKVSRAKIIRAVSDQQGRVAPEVEEYVACWLDVTLDGVTGDDAKQVIVLGTDSQYRMNGRHVLLRKA